MIRPPASRLARHKPLPLPRPPQWRPKQQRPIELCRTPVQFLSQPEAGAGLPQPATPWRPQKTTSNQICCLLKITEAFEAAFQTYIKTKHVHKTKQNSIIRGQNCGIRGKKYIVKFFIGWTPTHLKKRKEKKKKKIRDIFYLNKEIVDSILFFS